MKKYSPQYWAAIKADYESGARSVAQIAAYYSVSEGAVYRLQEMLQADILQNAQRAREDRVFQHIDGIKFLTHDGGCGGIRQDSEALCNLLAGYITHPNVAGATVLSLGCRQRC